MISQFHNKTKQYKENSYEMENWNSNKHWNTITIPSQMSSRLNKNREKNGTEWMQNKYPFKSFTWLTFSIQKKYERQWKKSRPLSTTTSVINKNKSFISFNDRVRLIFYGGKSHDFYSRFSYIIKIPSTYSQNGALY